MVKNSLLYCFILLSTVLFGQESIEGSMAFQTDPAKKYSIYVPSGYDMNTPSKMMLGLHPFNVSRWNSTSWRDHLIDFVEANNLLLICPDGGSDGKIDDQIDTAFTTIMIDSMLQWYNVNEDKIFVMGFSWGGRTVYSYGLNNAEKFAGFMPIGAAAQVFSGNESWFENAKDKPFYLIHGSNDSPSSRFTRFVDALGRNEACVETNLLQGVGHTVDFTNRTQIFTDAFNWLDNRNCGISNVDNILESAVNVFPNPIRIGEILNIESALLIEKIELFDQVGKLVLSEKNTNQVNINSTFFSKGFYPIKIQTTEGTVIKKVEIF